MKLKTLALIAASSVIALPAFAADWDITSTDTAYKTLITNNSALNYSVAGVSQTEVTADVDFKVDRKLIFSLTGGGSNTVTITASTSVLDFTDTYTIKNDSNAPIAIKLPSFVNVSPTEDSVTRNSIDVTADANGNYLLDAGDTDSNTHGDTLTITLKTTITPAQVNAGTVVEYDFNVTAVEPATTIAGAIGTPGAPIVITADSTAWDKDAVQTIGIPAAGDGSNTGGNRTNPKKYEFVLPNLGLVKTVKVISDPITGVWVDGGNQPKAIPGAVIEYTLTVVNTGAGSAENLTITDSVPAELDLLTGADVYKIDDVSIVAGTPAATGEELAISGKDLTFSKLNVPADPDTLDANNNGETKIVFTVKLP